MTISRVQGNAVASSGSVTSLAGTLGSGVAQGNLLVAAVTTGATANAVTPPSGWAQAVFNQPNSPANCETGLWWTIVSAGQAGQTSWNFSFNSSHNSYIIIEEWNSTTGWMVAPVDQSAVGNTAGTATTSTTPSTGTTGTTLEASELWVATLTYSSGVQTESSITSGWTKDLETHDSGNNHTATMLYQIASSTGAASCQYTIGTGEHWAGAVATFKPAGLRTIPTSAVLIQTGTRTIPTSAVLASNQRIIPTSAALKTTASRTIPTSAVLKSTLARTIPTSAVLKISPIVSGGFGVWANGTGTASFDHLRCTQYPDPALNLAPVLDRLATSMSWWTANTPTGSTLTIKTSLDGVNWSTATNGSAITGLNGQNDPTIDTFTVDSSANYTGTNKSGGSTATITYDTTNRRITMAGGSGALYLNSSISTSDIDILCDMDRSDAGGLVWRYQDSSNYYELGAYDDSASGGFTNTLRLYKVSAGTRSLLGTASVITWPRSTPATSPYRRMRVTMLGAIITVSIDGVLMQTYTDGSPLGTGKCGLRNDGGTSRYYQLRIQPRGDYVSGNPAGDIVTSDFIYTQATLTTTDPSVMPQLLDLTTSGRSPSVASGALIPQLHDPSKPFAIMLNKELDGLSTASGDFTWNESKAGALSFLERHATPAPFCLHSSDLQFVPVPAPTTSADLYRNRMKIINCIDITPEVDETKVADGSASSWQMAYPLYSAPTVIINGVTRTIGVQGVDTGKDFYWQAGSNAIGQDSGAVKIPAGTAILFSYIGQFPVTVTRDNAAGIAERAVAETGTSGIIEWIEDGKGMLASNAKVYADGLLARYGTNNAIELTATTLRNNPAIESGMMVPVFIPEYGISNHQMLCTNVSIKAQEKADESVLYTYALALTEGANLQNWTKVFGL